MVLGPSFKREMKVLRFSQEGKQDWLESYGEAVDMKMSLKYGRAGMGKMYFLSFQAKIAVLMYENCRRRSLAQLRIRAIKNVDCVACEVGSPVLLERFCRDWRTVQLGHNSVVGGQTARRESSQFHMTAP